MKRASRRHRLCLSLLVLAWACARAPETPDGAPLGRLPRDVQPLRYTLTLAIDPGQTRIPSTALIDVHLDRPRREIWLHGRGLEVSKVTVTPEAGEPVPARWVMADPSGVASLRLRRAVGPGAARIRIDYAAAYGDDLRGIYRVEVDGDAYAFTQFEPVSARSAFPCFDEPAFKVPFDVTLVVPEGDVAVGNTPTLEEQVLAGGSRRVRFAPTPPLPTYLLAWAVGPLDVVDANPLPPRGIRSGALPFRGVAVRGRGAQLARALQQTPPLIERLEDYFQIPYPYAKLDVIAVPDFGAGAMENAGAIFFREEYLLLDGPGVSESQRRGFAYVMAHELAHQWFGNLVTMPWWNDLWLNEAFATWMGRKTEAEVFPENDADGERLQAIHWAMKSDGLVSARSIRQPVASQHDIYNAFDAITYSKGGGVLAMFERWLGPESFRSGIHSYLEEHRLATATATDLIAALSLATGRDVATPFRSFLDQPGVPLVEAKTACTDGGGGIQVRQQRYLPLGSTGERGGSWQIPLCIRYGTGGAVSESCQLLATPEARIALDDACPDWFMPNADAAGYYRFALDDRGWDQLRRRGWAQLNAPERLSVAENLEVAFRAGATSAEAAFGGLAPLAQDANRRVAVAPMALLKLAREHLVEREQRGAVERFGAELYTSRLTRIGWDPAATEDGEVKLLRGAIVDFLALDARDDAVRREAEARGRRFAGLDGAAPEPGAVPPELVETALAVAVQRGGEAVFDALLVQLGDESDAATRRKLLRALAATEDASLAARARALSLDPSLRRNEVWTPLYRQVQSEVTREATWRWIEEHFDALVSRAGSFQSGWMPWLAAGFCDAERAAAVEAFLAPRISAIEGGPRNLAASLEAIRLCAALTAEQGPPTNHFFAARP